MTWPKKKAPQLLPKTLAERAEKMPAEKVEAEVLRIVQAAPAAPTPWAGAVEPGSLLPASVWRSYQQAFGSMQQAAQQQRLERQGMLQGSIFGGF